MQEDLGFRDRLQRWEPKPLWGGSDDLWKYREAASVLATFDFTTLRAAGNVSSMTAKTELLADCDVAHTADGKMAWSLRRPVRQAALRRLLLSGSVQAALDSNPDRQRTDAQALLELYLTGGDLPPRRMRSAELRRALLEVVDWLSGLPELAGRLPSVDSIKQRIAWEQLLQPFRELVGTTFAGRRKELGQLADYVGLYDAQSISESVTRAVENILSIKDRPPLFINGPGGSGKSTLISRFILDHAEIEDSSRFPFAYLDFDRPGLVAEEPITLLTEIMRQLAIQFPESADRYRQLSDEWYSRVVKQVSESSTPAQAPARPRFELTERETFLDDFAEFVNGLKTTNQPLLLVLDTFEEVQFRSAAFADEVLDFLEALQSRVPRLRTVLSGRADVRSSRYKVRTVVIGNFDKDAGVAFLTGRGIHDSQVAQKIFDQVGGSPLVLRLAADVAKLEKVDQSGIEGLPSGWLSLFQSQSIEVVLYKRILSHVYDSRVQQLAYPGLVLRVITPEVLEKVLAASCSVTIASREESRELLATMRGQLTTILVPRAGDEETLIHRPDMRAILLQDLTEKSRKDATVAATLRKIHEAAIAFYEKFEDPAQRAEELYHRLALGVDRVMLNARWEAGLNPYLGSSIRELPQPSQIYLAARLGIELSEEIWAKADDEDWILYAIRATAQKSELGKPLDALDLLSLRPHLYGHQTLHPIVERIAFEIFHNYALEYEKIRQTQKAGDERTRNMDTLVGAVSNLQRRLPDDPAYPLRLFAESTTGARVVALAVALTHPHPEHMDLAIEAIRNARSPFEQFHALRLAQRIFDLSSAPQHDALDDAIRHQEGVPIHESDPSRVRIKNDLLRRLDKESGGKPRPVQQT
jgi:hypothetical protein